MSNISIIYVSTVYKKNLKNQILVPHSSNCSVSFNRFLLQEILAAKEDPLCPLPSLSQLSAPALHYPQSACVQPRALSRAGDIQKTIEMLSIQCSVSSPLLLTRMLLLDSLHHPQIDCIYMESGTSPEQETFRKH